MSRIAVVHTKFETIGGAEVVCMRTLETLQWDDHEVTLFSFDDPDFETLNAFCGTDVAPMPVHKPERLGAAFNTMVVACNRATVGRCGAHIKLKAALLNRLVYRRTARFDLRISTSNEMALPHPSVQYIHFPQFNNRLHDGPTGAEGPVSGAYDWACTRIAGIRTDRLREAQLLTNSNWTAGVVESQYGIRPIVLQPPVKTAAFEDVPWSDREQGFVTTGRIAPDKRTLDVIDIVAGVRDRGHDVHLHVIGPTTDRNDAYRERVTQAAAAYDFVHLDGAVPREQLISLICNHRFGIHGKPHEHFGISIAELVAGGTIPFVPNGGGQVAIVGEREELLYSTPEMAIDKIDRVLSDPDRQSRLRRGLARRAKAFGVSDFRTGIRRHVDTALSETVDR